VSDGVGAWVAGLRASDLVARAAQPSAIREQRTERQSREPFTVHPFVHREPLPGSIGLGRRRTSACSRQDRGRHFVTRHTALRTEELEARFPRLLGTASEARATARRWRGRSSAAGGR
jgi:hypothetical protein